MITKDGIIIFEGQEILQKLGNEYLRSFQAKMFLSKDKWRNTKEARWYDLKLGLDENGYDTTLNFCSPIERVEKLVENLKMNEWYIFTIYGMHHQQLINAAVLDVNFSIKDRKLYSPWRTDQCYPGYPEYTTDYVYDEWGVPASFYCTYK